MYRKMLAPLDVSELSAASFPYITELTARLGLDVILLHVHSPDKRGSVSRLQADIEHKAEIVRRRSEEVQERIGIEPGSKVLKVQGEVALGPPAEEILRCANENDIDLILMATHGRSGIKRLVIGSVAEKVLRTSNVPVWLVRPGAPEEAVYDQWPGSTILVPLDGSEFAEAVLPHVEALAEQRGTEPVNVILLRIYERPAPPPVTEATPVMPKDYMQMMQIESARRKQESEEYLAEIENQLKDAGLMVRSQAVEGRPAEQIIDYANANPGNLIVMSTHARSGLGRLARGSVAIEVLQKASSPIVLVRPPRSDSS